jgi:hypothetical protein
MFPLVNFLYSLAERVRRVSDTRPLRPFPSGQPETVHGPGRRHAICQPRARNTGRTGRPPSHGVGSSRSSARR